MTSIPEISIEEYNYNLPEERIAKKPLSQRDESKLLVCNQGNISEAKFNSIAQFVPENSILIVNNTKVIQARLIFFKETGAKIEIFCLEPFEQEITVALSQKGSVRWNCMVGNSKKWKENKLIARFQEIEISAERTAQSGVVKFCWDADISFAEILDKIGKVPLPPYLNRESTERDKHTYQTVYAEYDGSVAAPTAGLHFTERVFEDLHQKNIEVEKVTLHVGAGTFAPVKSVDASKHIMHHEFITINKSFLKHLKRNSHKKIIAVGTTSLRTLESVYWIGCKIYQTGELNKLVQWENLKWKNLNLSLSDSIEAILTWMEKKELSQLSTDTQLMIIPGYEFKVVSGLITNFHQPKSTLLLLVSALIGNKWKKVYNYAMDNDFRFLSYGDSSLLLP